VGLRSDKLPNIIWCHVPGGRQQIAGVANPFVVSPFFISKFVVSLAQFNAFAEGKSYEELQWWQDLPIKPSEHPPIRQYPEIPNHPAQFVSWYQAFAYCRWLSGVLGYTVRLPTEWEWQQAATGGHEDFLYPWGPQWHPEYANTREGGVGHLMSVGLYPVLGASPVGALDMSGNMYEWCANEFEDVHNVSPSSNAPRTTRGGAFFTLGKMEAREGAKVTARLKDNANGYNESGNRIRVCVRLACDHPPRDAVATFTGE
jgi:formylglycine-generating enzyme required for sulfatase activity